MLDNLQSIIILINFEYSDRERNNIYIFNIHNIFYIIKYTLYNKIARRKIFCQYQ